MKLPVETHVIPGESLLGYIARAADRNGHPLVQHLLGLVGIRVHRPDFLCSHPIPDPARMAHFFGCEIADIEIRRRENLSIEGTTAKFMDFFGSPVRIQYCERELRRVSSQSLLVSPHHRAVWMLRPLPFCRESGERLISVCPNPSCGKPLKWRYAYGVGSCESCLDEELDPTTDLRDFPTAVIDPELAAPYNFVAGLVDPDASVRDDCRRQVPPALAHLPNWQIFELAVTVAGIHMRRASRRQGGETMILSAFEKPEWTRSVAFVGDVLLRWPAGAADLVADMRAHAASRKGHFGIFKELGPLANFGRREGLLPNLVSELNQAVVAAYKADGRDDTRSSYQIEESPSEFIRYMEAVEKYGLSGPKMTKLLTGKNSIPSIRAEGAGRAPVYIKERDLQDVLARAKELVRVARLTCLLGMPPVISSALATSGHLRVETGPAARLRGSGNLYIHPSEITIFQQRVQNASRPASSNDLTFMHAIRRCDIRAGQILPLVRDCLEGRIQFSLPGGNFDDLSRLQFDPDDLRAWSASKLSDESADAELPDVLTTPDVSILLGVSRSQVTRLLDSGALTVAPYGTVRKVRADSVALFDQKYVSSYRASEVFGICPIDIFDYLIGAGLTPAARLEKHDIVLWFRKDFDDLKRRALTTLRS